MPKSPTRTQDTLSSSLLAFKPRQLLLANLVMKQSNPITLSPDQKGPLLHAVAKFLEGNGFSKTLKRFLSEAQIEKNGLKESSLDLEEMYCRYTEMCNNGKTNANTQKENGDEQVCKEESKKPEQVKEAEKNNKATKKQKGKIVSDTPDAVEQCKLEPSSGATKESFKDASVKGKEVDDSEEKEKKSKDKKKKKKKLNDDSVEQCSLEAKQDTNGAIESIVDEDIVDVKPKGKKKKKDSSDEDKVAALGDTNVTILKKENFKTSDVDAIDNKENKGSKKRKRLESVGNDSEPANNKENEEIKRRKVEDSKESKGREQPENNDMLLGDDEQLNEKSSELKSSKKQRHGPAEPKTAFQRVKIEEVVFIDERLKDNSYWAKDGADIGYGAKAQEILGQVRGRDFRHEKTKKKRGTYRGGQIDLQSHSVKFNYSDED